MDTETAYDDDSEPTEDPEEESSVPTGAPDAVLPSFDETLRVHDVVGGRYEVTGVCGRGMSGETYWGRDQRTDVNVVVKPLRVNLPHAKKLAKQEDEALAQGFGHPNLVIVHDRLGAEPDRPAFAGFIVMEALEGPSLGRRLREAPGRAPLGAVPDLLDWILRALPGITHLHRHDLAFCDIKPDHLRARLGGASLTDAHVKWLDLGGVAKFGREGGPWFATPGYRDPSLSDDGPSVATDMYAIGRTIAAVIVPQGRLLQDDPLPTPDEAPILAVCPSLDRLLRKATHKRKDRRFASVTELSGRLEAVIRDLRRVPHVAGRPRRQLFTVVDVGFGVGPTLGRLAADGIRPVPVAPTASEVASCLPAPVDRAAEDLPRERQPAARLPALVRSAIERDDDNVAAEFLDLFAAADPDEWRVAWYRGLLDLRAGRLDEARTRFDEVADAMPGEPTPELAVAVTTELCGDLENAAAAYEMVVRMEERFVAASFGLARCCWALGESARAVDALSAVPPSSRHHDAATLGAARLLLAESPNSEHFERAGGLLGSTDDLLLRIEMLLVAWQAVAEKSITGVFLGVELSESAVRSELSSALRRLARADGWSRAARIRVVDLSHAVRRPTWW